MCLFMHLLIKMNLHCTQTHLTKNKVTGSQRRRHLAWLLQAASLHVVQVWRRLLFSDRGEKLRWKFMKHAGSLDLNLMVPELNYSPPPVPLFSPIYGLGNSRGSLEEDVTAGLCGLLHPILWPFQQISLFNVRKWTWREKKEDWILLCQHYDFDSCHICRRLVSDWWQIN